MANTYKAIASTTLTSTASSIDFTSISSAYTDLVLICYLQDSGTASYIRINGDSGSNYSRNIIYGSGGSAAAYRDSGTTIPAGGQASPNFAPQIFQFMNYSNTTTYKTVVYRQNEAANFIDAGVSLWRSTSAINRITLNATSTNSLQSGTTVSLYGIASAAVGAKATGGDIIGNDGVYYYHAFKSSGTFTPLQSLTADVLVIAGGGGGAGGYEGGAGGAGGIQYLAAASLANATAYTCTIGGGGAGTTGGGGPTANGANGTNSSISGSGFSTITANGGGGGAGYAGSGASNNGSAGGSGGGAGRAATGGASNQSSSGGAISYGNAGGNGGGASPGGQTGGGGGAGAAGAAGNGAGVGGVGGIGLSTWSSWGLATGTGQFVSGLAYFAGGGGGADNSNAIAGGAGGGGASSPSVSGQNGTANTGGGAGGTRAIANGGAGGSGLVIVRYPI